MATITLTASTLSTTVPAKITEKNTVTIGFFLNTGATVISASTTPVFLCKIPHGATVLDYKVHHSTGATACAADYGYSGGGVPSANATLSAFGTAQAQAAYNSANKGPASTAQFTAGVPQKISLSDDAQPRYTYFTGKYGTATGTTSLIIQGTLTYTMDGGI